MKRVVLILGSISVFILSPAAWGNDKANYFSTGVGLYSYTGDISDKTRLDGAFIVEFTFGRLFHSNFALEVGAGYLHDGHLGDELQGYPLTLTAKGVYPFEKGRLFVGGGAGVYFMHFDGEIENVKIDRGKDTVFGGHLLMGGDIYIHPSVFLGIEGKYLFIEKADFKGETVELDGFVITVKIGYSF